MNGCQDNTHARIQPHASASFQYVCPCSNHPFPEMYTEHVSMFWRKYDFPTSTQSRQSRPF